MGPFGCKVRPRETAQAAQKYRRGCTKKKGPKKKEGEKYQYEWHGTGGKGNLFINDRESHEAYKILYTHPSNTVILWLPTWPMRS